MKRNKKEFSMNDDYHQNGALEAILEAFDTPLEDALAATEERGEALEPASLSAQVDQVVQGLSGAKTAGQVYLIDVRQLEPYPDQPFKLYPQQRLEELAEDIGRVGILSPILARRHGKKLQILAGHNRWAAAKLAGLSDVPVLLVDADDDQAVLVVTSTNLRQREKLSPSEKAFAYKMQMDALKRQGQRMGEGYHAANLITQQTGDSRIQIHRYVRLTQLEPGLLALLDREKISMTPAVAVSYLQGENQAQVLELIRDFGASLTIDRASSLKTLAQQADPEPLSRQDIDGILLQTKRNKADKARISFEHIRQYLPEGTAAEDAEAVIIAALKAYGGQGKL